MTNQYKDQNHVQTTFFEIFGNFEERVWRRKVTPNSLSPSRKISVAKRTTLNTLRSLHAAAAAQHRSPPPCLLHLEHLPPISTSTRLAANSTRHYTLRSGSNQYHHTDSSEGKSQHGGHSRSSLLLLLFQQCRRWERATRFGLVQTCRQQDEANRALSQVQG